MVNSFQIRVIARIVLAAIFLVIVLCMKVISSSLYHKSSDGDKVISEQPPTTANTFHIGCQSSLLGSYTCLPDIINIGAQKCGTSALLYFFRSHPQLAAVSGEPHYWDTYAMNYTLSWYHSMMPSRKNIFSSRNDTSSAIYFMEKSPAYMAHPKVAMRMSSSLRDVRLLVFLRNPTDRFLSQYHHNTVTYKYREKRSLEQVVADEIESSRRVFASLRRCYTDNDDYFCNFEYGNHPGELLIPAHHMTRAPIADKELFMTQLLMSLYLYRGCYAMQLSNWFTYYPNVGDRYYIAFFEDMLKDPDVFVQRLTEWIGITNRNDVRHGLTKDKTTSSAKRKGGANPDLVKSIAQLDDFYRPRNAELKKLLELPHLPSAWVIPSSSSSQESNE